MKLLNRILIIALLTTIASSYAGDGAADMTKPVQVYILMGQSNMLGFGRVSSGGGGGAAAAAGKKGKKSKKKKGGGGGAKGPEGSLEHAVKTKKLYPYLIDNDGKWTVRKDVRNVRVTMSKGKMIQNTNDWMSISTPKVGPEIGIGHALGDAIDAPVLILKACIGNRSLGWDLLPPGSKPYDYNGKLIPGYRGTRDNPRGDGSKPESGWYAGKQYDDDTTNAKKVLAELSKYYPGATKYEVAGFFWWQGDKDMRDPALFTHYEKNLVQLLTSLRKDFNAPNAKFVCASLGQTKKGSTKGDGKILDAMFAFAANPAFKGSVGAVYTNPLSKGGSSSAHYSGNAETYMNVGEAMGKKMVELLKK